MAIQNFRVTDTTFHRNGISGRSFWTVRFSYDEEGTFYPNMMAVMPSQPNEQFRCGKECFVVDLNNPTNNWRGDYFFELVKDTIAKRTDG